MACDAELAAVRRHAKAKPRNMKAMGKALGALRKCRKGGKSSLKEGVQ